MKPIGRGHAGREVADVQRRLEALGHSCAPDDPGVFDAATHRCVQAFQQLRGLTADGVVGDETWRALVEAGWRLGDRLLYLTRPPLRGDDVRELQRRLNNLGFDAGNVDGVFGPATFEALRDFQLNVGVPVDGMSGAATLEGLTRLHRGHQAAPAFAVREREVLRWPTRRSLAGARVLVDPGRGPADPGVTGPTGALEHEVTWRIASRVEGRLMALGAHAVLARGPASTPSASTRAELANREEVDAIVSIHLNGLDSRFARGSAGYYFGQEGYVSERGRHLARLAVERIVARTGTADCRIHPGTTAILRETRAPAAIVEPGFLTHPDEGRRLVERGYQAMIAEAIVDAVTTFLLGDARPAAVTADASMAVPSAPTGAT